jgi:DCN1-like protein 1/2
MKYLGDIQVQLDEVACLGIAELLQSPSMGEFTREGFLNGWRRVGYVSAKGFQSRPAE